MNDNNLEEQSGPLTNQEIAYFLRHKEVTDTDSPQQSQMEMAQDLIDEICADIDELEELDPLFLLDMLGILGLSLTVSSEASEAFVEECRKIGAARKNI
jgi:hypothetical protein